MSNQEITPPEFIVRWTDKRSKAGTKYRNGLFYIDDLTYLWSLGISQYGIWVKLYSFDLNKSCFIQPSKIGAGRTSNREYVEKLLSTYEVSKTQTLLLR